MKKFNIPDPVATLYDYLGLEHDSVADDMENNYLTLNAGADGHDYYFYYDGVQECAACASSGRIVSDPAEFEKLFFWYE